MQNIAIPDKVAPICGGLGVASSNSKPDKSNYTGGFTLIELLVVLIILGMFTGMIVLSMGDSFARNLRGEAERFHRVLLAGVDEAVYSNSELGFLLSKEGYTLLRFDRLSNQWQSFNTAVFQPYQLPAGMQLDWTIEGFSRTPKGESRYGGDTDELFEGFGSADEKQSDDVITYTPQVLMLSSGELTAFEVLFSATESIDNEAEFVVLTDGFARPRIRQPRDDDEYLN